MSADRDAPAGAPAPASERGRAELLDQIAYVGDELAMLAAVLPRMPETLHSARAFDGDDSLKSALARLAARDTARRAALPTGTLDVTAPDASINADAADAAPTAGLLDRAIAARAAFLDAATALDDDTFARLAPALHAAVLADADLWKRLAEQFFDARGVR